MRSNLSSNIQLVKVIEKYPCLYNSTLAEYSKKDVTDDAWLKVVQEVNDTVFHCKEKWRNLRTIFVRQTKLRSNGLAKKPYYLKDVMDFILPYVRPPPQSKAEESQLTIQTDEPSVEWGQNGDTNCLDVSPQLVERGDFSDCELRVPKVSDKPKLRKRRGRETSKADKLVEPRSKIHCTDSFRKMFLLSLLPELSDLTDTQMRRFKRDVLELIDDVRSEDSAESGGFMP